MTYAESATLAQDSGFRTRVHVAVFEAAIAIMADMPTTGFEAYYDARANFARSMIAYQGDHEPFVWAVALNAAIVSVGTAAPDGDIAFVVSSVWDALAGITAAQHPA